MKALAILTTALITFVPIAYSQNAARPVAAPAVPAALGASSEAESGPLIRVKFKGGKVKEFVDAVSEALKASTGKQEAIVNVIIPPDCEHAVIPTIDVLNVTVGQLFAAVSAGSQREIPVQTSITQASGTRSSTVQYKAVQYSFVPSSSNGAEPVWTFVYPNGGTQPPIPAEPKELRYFQISQFLEHFTVEDITTAVTMGWKTAEKADDEKRGATLSFHDETGLLIGSGTDAELRMVDEVLKQLTPALTGLRRSQREAARVAEQSKTIASRLVFPKVEFLDATGPEALTFIAKKTEEISKGQYHVRFTFAAPVDGAAPNKLSLSAANMGLDQLLELATERLSLEPVWAKDGVTLIQR